MATQPPIPPDEEAPDFIPDDEAPDFIPDESLASPNQPVPGHPAERMASAMVRGGIKSLNPIEWAKAAYALGKMGVKTTLNPSSVFQTGADIASGIKETGAAALGQRGPEAAGDVWGGMLATGVPFVGAAAAKPVAQATADALRRSRATNIVRAIKGSKGDVVAVTAAGDAAELPISFTQGSLARKLAKREAVTGEAVGRLREELPGDVPYADVAERIPEVGTVIEGRSVTGDRALRRVTESGRRYWEDLATDPTTSGTIPRRELAARKTEAGGAAERGGVYEKGRTDMPISPGAQASADEAAAIKAAVLERAGLSPEDAAKVAAYEAALDESSLAKTLSGPAQTEHLRRVRNEAGDWKAGLAGRVGAYSLFGGGGGLALGPGGALGGIAVAEFMRSTPWQTLSAAGKLKAIRALESGGIDAFRDAAMAAIIAETGRRRTAESALRAQGEGVTAP